MPVPITAPVRDLLTAIAAHGSVEELLVVKVPPLAIGVRRHGKMHWFEGVALLTIAQRALAELRREATARELLAGEVKTYPDVKRG